MREPLEYSISFADAVAELKSRILDDVASARAWIEESNQVDPIYVKNASSVVVASNNQFVRSFTGGLDPVGRNSGDFLDLSMRSASKLSDALISGPAREIDFTHEGRCSDGATYELRSFKLSLRELGEPSWVIGGLSRRIARLHERSGWVTLSEEGRFEAFNELSESDRWVCQQVALGRSSMEIGDEMGLTRRAIEMRKRKVLDALGLKSTAELIRMMVRLHDGGYVDLGL